MDEKDTLADVLFTLIGDLAQSGTLSNWKRDLLWERINAIRDAIEDSDPS